MIKEQIERIMNWIYNIFNDDSFKLNEDVTVLQLISKKKLFDTKGAVNLLSILPYKTIQNKVYNVGNKGSSIYQTPVNKFIVTDIKYDEDKDVYLTKVNIDKTQGRDIVRNITLSKNTNIIVMGIPKMNSELSMYRENCILYGMIDGQEIPTELFITITNRQAIERKTYIEMLNTQIIDCVINNDYPVLFSDDVECMLYK